MKNECAFLTADRQLELREIEVPAAGPDEVVVKLEYSGICGSDLLWFVDGTFGGVAQKYYPIVLGHEGAGVVASVGESVTHLRVGDKVAVEPGIPCGKCKYCLSGRYNLCPSVNFMAAWPWTASSLRNYIAWPANFCYKLPENVDTLAGAMMEPFGIGMFATKRAGVFFGDTAAILGAGTIGIMNLAACIVRGAKRIVMVDIFDNRLDLARSFAKPGVEVLTVNSQNEDPVKRIRELIGGDGPDFVFESAGSPATCAITPYIPRRGGTVVQVGNVHAPLKEYNVFPLMLREINVVNSFRSANVYPECIQAVASGLADIKKIVTHVFDFRDTQKAFEFALTHKNEALKVAIKID